MKNLHAVKSIMFSDMPSMSYFTEKRASGKVNEKGENNVRQTDCSTVKQLGLENERKSNIFTGL